MKILLHTNAPTAPTGYGVTAALLCDMLAEAGHEVAVSVTWGHQAGIGTWTSPGGHSIRLYPSGIFTNSPDTIMANAMHFFDGDPEAGWIIPLLDVWALAGNVELQAFNVAAWAPVDHLPVPVQVREFFTNTNAVPIAMSRFGEDQFRMAGLDPLYAPLAVNTDVYKPTTEIDGLTAADVLDIPAGAFVFLSVAMNKDPGDRKGFNEMFRAFGAFHADHPDAVLYMHTERHGVAGGLDLVALAEHAGIPPHAIIWANDYAYRLGAPDNMMALLYTRADVLLAPSHGEGFGIPLIEAQACGTPVICSDFSSQSELVGPGWLVTGQLVWDDGQKSSYLTPYTADVLAKMTAAHDTIVGGDSYADDSISAECMDFAARYDHRRVFAEHWVGLLEMLDPPPADPKPKLEQVDVIVPVLRPENAARFLDSLNATTAGLKVLHGSPDKSYAENVNELLKKSSADWVLVVGDDVEFMPNWLEIATVVSPLGDVIGTNDSEPGRIRNPDVAAGRHADHYLIRRSYIEEVGASLDGPGICMPEAYGHWYVDKEVVGLAKARGVFVMAPECRIVHHHPGYDGDEDARAADPLYRRAVESAAEDERTFMSRAPLIEAHRVAVR